MIKSVIFATLGSCIMKNRVVGCICLIICMLLSPSVADARSKKKYPEPPRPGQLITIEDTVYGVLRTHRTLRGMLEDREVVKHELDRARAGFGPRIDLTGRAGGSVLSDSSTRAQDLDRQMWGLVGGSAKLVQPIWDGFATRSRVRNAQSTLDSVRSRVFDTATSLTLDGIIAHIDLLRRRVTYELAEQNVAEHRAILSQAEERAQFGADTAAEVTQTQSRLARAESSLSEAKAALLVAESTYQRLTGILPGKFEQITMPPDVFESAASVYALAEKSNHKLAAYMSDIRAARAKREEAESAFYPTFNLEAGPDYSNRGGGTDRWIYSFDVLGTVRWNVFNSGADLAEYKAASARIREARQVMYNYMDDLKLDIETTWSNYVAAQEQYRHYSKAVEYNKFTKAAYLEQFSIGKRSLLDVLDTISELYNSSTQAENARGNILVGAYRLSALTGNMLPSMSIDTSPMANKPPVDAEDKREAFEPGWFK